MLIQKQDKHLTQSYCILQPANYLVTKPLSIERAKLTMLFLWFFLFLSPSKQQQQQKKAWFLNCKWHCHYRGIEVPFSFSWYYTEPALTLSLSKTSASLHSLCCFCLGAVLFFLPLWSMSAPPSQPCPVFGGFSHGDHPGGLPPGTWNNTSVPSLAWQWEPAFLGAQILQSLSPLLRVDNIYVGKKNHWSLLFLICWFAYVLFWFTTPSQNSGLIVSINRGCHLQELNFIFLPLWSTYGGWEMVSLCLHFHRFFIKKLTRKSLKCIYVQFITKGRKA